MTPESYNKDMIEMLQEEVKCLKSTRDFLEANLKELRSQVQEARRIAEAYREVWEDCSRAVDKCQIPDPLPWKEIAK